MHSSHQPDTAGTHGFAAQQRGCHAMAGMPADFDEQPQRRGHHGSGSHGRGCGSGGGGGGQRGRRRMFRHGTLRLLALYLISVQPRHGYELIKAIEELAGGDYSPSPGAIYPTLTLLADLGWVRAADQDDGRKQYVITPDGRVQLESQREELQILLERLRTTRREAGFRGAPELQRAMQNLRMALQLRLGQGDSDRVLIRRVAELIDQAAVGIERL